MPEITTVESRERLREVKVGVFVLGIIMLGFGIVFFLGQKNHLFESQAVLHASFTDVQGLTEGAPVRLAGVKIGNVAKVKFSPDHNDKHILVDLQITNKMLAQLGGDPIARIDSQGLLGDKIIEITPGDGAAPPPAPGSAIRTQVPADIGKIMLEAQQVMVKVQRVADGAAKLMDSISDPQTIGDLKGTVASVNKLLNAAQTGNGLAHSMFYDPATGKQFGQLIGQVSQLATEVNTGMKSINAILAQTDAEGRNLINNVSHTAKSIGDTATELRSSNVIANAARAMADADKTILDADKVVLNADKVMANANGFSKDLADMAAYMKQGRGTMGGIIMDPILYERLLTILGGVERSRILRAVVRYAITKSDPPVVAQSIAEPAVPPPPKPLVPAKAVPATK